MPVTQLPSQTASSSRFRSRSHKHRLIGLESLESRTLMSATYDAFLLPGGDHSTAYALAQNAQGDLFAAGNAYDAAGVVHAVVRKLAVGAADWTTIGDLPGLAATFNGLTVSSDGNLFVLCGNATTKYVYEQVSGSNSFVVVDALPQAGNSGLRSLASDNVGNVFDVYARYAPASKQAAGGTWWTVRKWTPATGVFTTVDNWDGGFTGSKTVSQASADRLPLNVSVIPSGPAAGIYVVGYNTFPNTGNIASWTVRKSSDGGTNWRTVDSWVLDANSSNMGTGAWDVTGDAAGNVYVVGRATSAVVTGMKGKNIQYGPGPTHFIVRKSTGGEAGSWSVSDDTVFTNSTDVTHTFAYSIAVDPAGNVYAGGNFNDGTSNRAVIRTNAGGTWTTLPTYLGSVRDLLVDVNGTLYSAGVVGISPGNTWVVQTANTALTSFAVSRVPAPLTSSLQLRSTPSLTTAVTHTHAPQSLKPLTLSTLHASTLG